MWSLCVCACVCALLAVCEAACPPNCRCNVTQVVCYSRKVPKSIPRDTTTLNLGDNKIKQVPAESFKGLNRLEKLYLNKNSIKELPLDIFKGLDRLDIMNLDSNQLTILENGVFRDLSALRLAGVSNNLITQLQPDCFKGLDQIEKLYLHHNKITTLDSGLFRTLTTLKELDLSDNTIKELPPDIFKHLNFLDTLYLHANQLTSLESGIFHDLTAVKEITLGTNNIVELPPDIYKNLNRLEKIHLPENNIEQLPPDIFRDLSQVTIISIRDNKLKELLPGIFKDLNHLETLNANNNQLTRLEDGVFRGLTVLQSLTLNNNTINHLSPDTFKSLNHLEKLHLHNNQLTSFETGVFHGLPALRDLRLDNNPLVCDCKIEPIKSLLEDKEFGNKAICQSPSNLAGTYLEDMPEDNFPCSKPYFLKTPQDTNSNIGDKIILNCSAAGLPQPDISWSKDNSQVQSGGEIQITSSGSLSISKSARRYAGIYRCTATNSEGNISAVAQVKVYKMCPALESDSLSLHCQYGPTKVDCSKPMLPQTTVTFKCKPSHDEYPDLAKDGAYSKTLTCLQDRRWSSSLPKCKPACGVSMVDSIIDQKVIDGTETTPGAYPWHVGLYVEKENSTEYICGGSLISNRIVMTAAHCVETKARDLRVALGKYYRSWTHDEPNTVKRTVSAIRLPKEYRGAFTSYVWDVALLVLSQKVQIDSFIMPVCRDASFAPQQSINITANVVGWGKTEEGTTSETLLSTNLTVLEHEVCQRGLPQILAFDKMCGSKNSGLVVGKGDSGGGLTAVYNGLHYILGVVSVNYNGLTTFTNIYWRYHNSWIEDKIKEIENPSGLL